MHEVNEAPYFASIIYFSCSKKINEDSYFFNINVLNHDNHVQL